MKFLYPSLKLNRIFSSAVKYAFVLGAAFFAVASANAQSELVFKNPVLQSGTAGADNAVYRFSSVMSGVDALVKINGRSTTDVRLLTIDMTNTGWDKAFQPQVTYGTNDMSPNGNADWWMEFQISFVQAGTSIPAVVSAFDVTGLDIDGNGDKIAEYQTYYGLNSYTLEKKSVLTITNLTDYISGLLTSVGKRFDGPVTNYSGIDTSATTTMVTNHYLATNSFKMRTGATSRGKSAAADREYSMWFKGFNYTQPVTLLLPVTLVNWNAQYSNGVTALSWQTTVEHNASHFLVQRSFDGVEYSNIAMIFAQGNSEVTTNYSFNDKLPAANSGVIYYRLQMVDMNGTEKASNVQVVRVNGSNGDAKILAYPNPLVNELRVTIPQSWQGKKISYQVANANGQVMKTLTVSAASQTQIFTMTDVPAGMYVVRVMNGTETAVQAVVKAAH